MIVLDPDLESDRSLERSESPIPRARYRDNRLPSARTLERFLRKAQSAVKLKGQITVLLTTDGTIRRLNRQFRGKNKPTDVLSFPAAMPTRISRVPQVAGDIAISVDTARRQANELRHPLLVEVKVLLLHGLLHLAGYDHETDNGQMARLEQRLRAKLQLPHGLIERSVRA